MTDTQIEYTCPSDCCFLPNRDFDFDHLTVCCQCTHNPDVKNQYLTREQYIKENGIPPDF
ncbi:MAG: hypothetical protein FWH37_07140 [Candidatus Bathyarchaeota archaeon]|nr:hypothetical protein [Candidatus Termiticorpusculum sp.]